MNIRVRKAAVTVDVREADPVKDGYLTMPVMPVTAVFTYFDGGSVWAEVAGFKMRKDGLAGKVWASAMFRSDWDDQGDWPTWVREMAEQVRPAGFRKDVDTSPS